nr:radical SAM protein [uncultured Anaerostipes sp.]
MSEKKILRYDKKKGHCTAPYSVNIAVTERCPLKCPFCFQKYDHYHELSYQMVQKYIDEISSLGTAQVQFSGGEPLVYPYLLESISYAHSKGLYTVISTSGIGLSEDRARKLKISGLDRCYVSLNGSTAEIHGLTREGFDYAVWALEILSKTGVKTAINWVAYHENVNDLPDLITLAKSLNVQFVSVIPMKKNNEDKILNGINENDFMELVDYCKKFKGYLIVDSCFKELNKAIRGRVGLTEECRAGVFYMAINAMGEFLYCPHLIEKGVKFPSIKEYWYEDEELNYHRKSKSCFCVGSVLQ